jgi:hypothetical protein
LNVPSVSAQTPLGRFYAAIPVLNSFEAAICFDVEGQRRL